jgi:outer membrane protein assembly factor BamA
LCLQRGPHAKDNVDITVEISEGDPIVVEAVLLEGLDKIPTDLFTRLKAQLPIAVGKPRNQKLMLASHDMVVSELRDHGFPYATVRAVEHPGAEPKRVRLAVSADTGPESVFGSIDIEGDVLVSKACSSTDCRRSESGESTSASAKPSRVWLSY